MHAEAFFVPGPAALLAKTCREARVRVNRQHAPEIPHMLATLSAIGTFVMYTGIGIVLVVYVTVTFFVVYEGLAGRHPNETTKMLMEAARSMRWGLDRHSLFVGSGLIVTAILVGLVVGDMRGQWNLSDVLWRLYH